MSGMQMSSRQPYPWPKLENDDDFKGQRQHTHSNTHGQPTHIAQTKDPWNRLNSTCTLASSRREIFHHDPQAPRDSLDFIQKAYYDHHNELLKSKAETLMQPETLGVDHGRTLKNRPTQMKQATTAASPTGQLRVVSIHNPKKESTHSVKGAVESHHTPATNQGFSRKHDGTFYST
ncbi:protein CFAP276-like [Diadema setosum]|uniref:protein CFAP276-like n=1 Tax=Diadema setosum TaxID=31175 RepID=UPI003B3A2696